MLRVFADTFYWVALIHRKDASHTAVLEWSRAPMSVSIVTTDEVLTEVLAFCSSDKGYSLTDCISMQTMRREGLNDVLTNDRHFEQEGFHALF